MHRTKGRTSKTPDEFENTLSDLSQKQRTAGCSEEQRTSFATSLVVDHGGPPFLPSSTTRRRRAEEPGRGGTKSPRPTLNVTNSAMSALQKPGCGSSETNPDTTHGTAIDADQARGGAMGVNVGIYGSPMERLGWGTQRRFSRWTPPLREHGRGSPAQPVCFFGMGDAP